MSITSTSCKVLVTDASKGPVKEYFALVHWHEDSKQCDISLTDGHEAWSAAGCSMTHPQHVTAGEAWSRCKTALSDVTQPSSAVKYIFWTAEKTAKPDGCPDQLQLVWGWGSSQLGREVMRVVPWLDKQAEGAAAVRDIMRHMMRSYSLMKTAVVKCQQAQQQLERSLAEKEALLRQTAEARQDEEKVLFTKFAMLLNKKTERIVQLTDTLQQQAQRLERLQGSEEQDTDDEAREAAAIYEAETEDESDQEQQEPDQLTAAAKQMEQQQQRPLHEAGNAAFAALGGTAVHGALRGYGADEQQEGAADVDMQDALAGEQPTAAVTRLGAFADDQATQPLDAEVRAMLDRQHKKQLQQGQQQQLRPAGSPAVAAVLNAYGGTHGAGTSRASTAVGAAGGAGSIASLPAGTPAPPPAVVAPAQPRPGGVKRRIAR